MKYSSLIKHKFIVIVLLPIKKQEHFDSCSKKFFSFFQTGASDEPLTISSVFLRRALLTNAPKEQLLLLTLYPNQLKMQHFFYCFFNAAASLSYVLLAVFLPRSYRRYQSDAEFQCAVDITHFLLTYAAKIAFEPALCSFQRAIRGLFYPLITERQKNSKL